MFSVSFLELRLIRLYMSVTGSYLTFLVHLDPSLLGKVHVHSNGHLLVNVESTFHCLEKKLLKIYFFQSLESFHLLYRPSYR